MAARAIAGGAAPPGPGAGENGRRRRAALALTWRGGAGQRAPRLELEPDHADPTAGGEIFEGTLRRPRRADPKP
jgi:hypothetical protein